MVREIESARSPSVPQGTAAPSRFSIPRRGLVDTAPLGKMLRQMREDQVLKLEQQAVTATTSSARRLATEEVTGRPLDELAPITPVAHTIRNRGQLYEGAANLGKRQAYANEIVRNFKQEALKMQTLFPSLDAAGEGTELKYANDAHSAPEGLRGNPDELQMRLAIMRADLQEQMQILDPSGELAAMVDPALETEITTTLEAAFVDATSLAHAEAVDAHYNAYDEDRRVVEDKARVGVLETGTIPVDSNFEKTIVGMASQTVEKHFGEDNPAALALHPNNRLQIMREEQDAMVYRTLQGIIAEAKNSPNGGPVLTKLFNELNRGKYFITNKYGTDDLIQQITGTKKVMADRHKTLVERWVEARVSPGATPIFDPNSGPVSTQSLLNSIEGQVPGWRWMDASVLLRTTEEQNFADEGRFIEWYANGVVYGFASEYNEDGNLINVHPLDIGAALGPEFFTADELLLAARPQDALRLLEDGVPVDALLEADLPDPVREKLVQYKAEFQKQYGEDEEVMFRPLSFYKSVNQYKEMIGAIREKTIEAERNPSNIAIAAVPNRNRIEDELGSTSDRNDLKRRIETLVNEEMSDSARFAPQFTQGSNEEVLSRISVPDHMIDSMANLLNKFVEDPAAVFTDSGEPISRLLPSAFAGLRDGYAEARGKFSANGIPGPTTLEQDFHFWKELAKKTSPEAAAIARLIVSDTTLTRSGTSLAVQESSVLNAYSAFQELNAIANGLATKTVENTLQNNEGNHPKNIVEMATALSFGFGSRAAITNALTALAVGAQYLSGDINQWATPAERKTLNVKRDPWRGYFEKDAFFKNIQQRVMPFGDFERAIFLPPDLKRDDPAVKQVVQDVIGDTIKDTDGLAYIEGADATTMHTKLKAATAMVIELPPVSPGAIPERVIRFYNSNGEVVWSGDGRQGQPVQFRFDEALDRARRGELEQSLDLWQ